MKVVISAGHGGHDPGAVAFNLQEKDLNLRAALLLDKCLSQLGACPILTRRVDTFVSLQGQCDIEHTVKPACFVSLHCNAAENVNANGWEIWTSLGQTQADPLADAIKGQLDAALPSLRWRQDFSDGDFDKEKHLYVLDNTDCPAVLIEMGFLTNQADVHWLMTPGSLESAMWAVALAIVEWGKR